VGMDALRGLAICLFISLLCVRRGGARRTSDADQAGLTDWNVCNDRDFSQPIIASMRGPKIGPLSSGTSGKTMRPSRSRY
jgi:hypothetical protein